MVVGSGIARRIEKVIRVKSFCVEIECMLSSITTYNGDIIKLRYCFNEERWFSSDIRDSARNRLQPLKPAVWGAIIKGCFGNKPCELGSRETFTVPRRSKININLDMIPPSYREWEVFWCK